AHAPALVTLVAMGEDLHHPEDRACADYLEGLMQGRPSQLEGLLQPLYATERYQRLTAGTSPGFPASDVALCLAADRFELPMPVAGGEVGLKLAAVQQAEVRWRGRSARGWSTSGPPDRARRQAPRRRWSSGASRASRRSRQPGPTPPDPG